MRKTLSLFCCVFFVALILQQSNVTFTFSQCNQKKPGPQTSACVVSGDRCSSTQSSICDGSQGGSESEKIAANCAAGGTSDHCVTKAVSCGTWHNCEFVGNGCKDGATVKVPKVRTDENGNILKDQDGNPIIDIVDKPYERQSAVSIGCPNGA